MVDRPIREKIRWQQKVREENERKILDTLANSDEPSMRWRDLLATVGISKPQLAAHLRRMVDDGIIENHGVNLGGGYSITTKDSRRIFEFARMPDGYSTDVQIEDPQHCMAKNGMLLFNEREQRKAAVEAAEKLTDVFRFTIAKMLECQEKGDYTKEKLWRHHCLEWGLSEYARLYSDAYITGEFNLLTREGKRIGPYMEEVYRTPENETEFEHRIRLRRRYLAEAFKKTGNPQRMRMFESDLQRQ